ncbi:DUF3575 domain-containing protein [Hymenobacter sp. BT635]|uniref:DUF3575 domain-containing protein n=1 Tax=Hymenobacter nitidus TaxID=2880929 RepID=A0ABS8AHA8_9BACT|nr:DUF3575 domain-containing protein [Hymenobacter nitidus]MCB2378384.1 DUF3575 domain-containing protein [Hymenobacter nitidus]
MKGIYFLAGALLTASGAQAQNNVVKLDILQPITNTLALSFEHKLSEASSFQVGVYLTSNYTEDNNFFNSASYTAETSGIGLLPEYRLYLSEKTPALVGFYVAPFLRYQYLSRKVSDVPAGQPNADATLNAFGGGLTVGRHWIFKQRFSLDAFVGPSYMVSSVESDDPEIGRDDFLGFYENANYGLRGGITFGIAF